MKKVSKFRNLFCIVPIVVQVSINDDLESLLQDLENSKSPAEEAMTYFLPQLTEEELRKVEINDKNFMQTFAARKLVCPSIYETYSHKNPDVEIAEMQLSDSVSKFVQGLGWRRTLTI